MFKGEVQREPFIRRQESFNPTKILNAKSNNVQTYEVLTATFLS